MEAITSRHARKRYGQRIACDDISLTAHTGEIFGLLGPNGAGKSSFVKMVVDLVRPTSGTVRLFGAPPSSRAAKARMGFLPEGFRFHQWLTGEEVLRWHGKLYGLRGHALSQEIPRVLESVRLQGAERYTVGSYSKGMQQRLGLAVTLLPGPDLVVLDEPTSALDPIGRREVRELLVELRNSGIGVFLNSHLLSEVESVCDRVAFVRDGRIVESGVLSEILSRSVELELELGEHGPRAEELLRRFGSVRAAGSTLLVSGVDRMQVPELTRRLVAAGIDVYSVRPREESLEEVFVRLMGRGGE
jgi:ABC-2 type transport system ATP-binding protein